MLFIVCHTEVAHGIVHLKNFFDLLLVYNSFREELQK